MGCGEKGRGSGVEGKRKERRRGLDSRGRSLQIWAGTAATMGKGSAGVVEK